MNGYYKKAISLLLVGVIIMSIMLLNPASVFSSTSLKKGSSGSTVSLIQKRLKTWGYYNGSIDGVYGSKTEEAVRLFQKKNGAEVDGVVGEETAALIGISLSKDYSSSSSSSSPSSSSSAADSGSDIYLLAKVVYAEARGEPYTGQVAVAAVILNRVASPDFPNTIAGVVYQPWAFTCVNDGQINLSPDQSAINAARDAMNGWDPTYGALYYYNPQTATSQWVRNLKVHMTIGRHVFARS